MDDESVFDMLRRRSQSTNVKLRALAGQLVSDYRALSNGEALPPRWVYEKTLMTIHERITRDRSDSPELVMHRQPDVAHLNPLIGRPPSVLEPRRRVTAKRGDGWLRPNPDEGRTRVQP